MDSAEKGRLDAKTRQLEKAGAYLLDTLIDGPLPIRGVKYPHIYKLKIGKKVRLRPLLCRGPEAPAKEVTFLVGAREVNWKWRPRKALLMAKDRRENLISKTSERAAYATPPKGKPN